MTDTFAERQRAKWERVKDAIPGLQYSHTATGTHILRVSVDGFEDRVLFGRPSYERIQPAGEGPMVRSKRTATVITVPAIDLTDSEIDTVIDRWREGRRAETLLLGDGQ